AGDNVMAPLRWLTATVLFASAISTATATESIWEALRTPGSVVVLRHSYAPGGFDPPSARLDDCSTQRNLDASGRAQAGRVGEEFGQGQSWEPLQGALSDEERRRRQLAEIRKAIEAHRGGPPLVLVTHGSVVTDLTGLNIRMGEFVVLRRAADGTHSVAGQWYVE